MKVCDYHTVFVLMGRQINNNKELFLKEEIQITHSFSLPIYIYIYIYIHTYKYMCVCVRKFECSTIALSIEIVFDV